MNQYDEGQQPMAAPDNNPALIALEHLSAAIGSLEDAIDRMHSTLSFVLGPESAEVPGPRPDGDDPRHEQSAMTEALRQLTDRVRGAESTINETINRVEV